MIGVFDSGDGGLCTVEKIRELMPCADICFFADRQNAPYGTKSRSEIITLTKKNIKRLKHEGAQKVLIACCTASSVYPALSEEEKAIAVPIIDATARAAIAKTKSKKIGVIATKATVLSGAFERSIKRILPDAEVYTEQTQELVSLIESGECDANLKRRTYEKLEKILKNIRRYPYDVLILGCTHFPRLEKTISDIVQRETVSSALAGAEEILKAAHARGSGKNIFL